MAGVLRMASVGYLVLFFDEDTDSGKWGNSARFLMLGLWEVPSRCLGHTVGPQETVLAFLHFSCEAGSLAPTAQISISISDLGNFLFPNPSYVWGSN